MFRITLLAPALLLLIAPLHATEPSDEKPLCRIAAISNIYATTKATKLAANRTFLAKTSPVGIKRTLLAVESVKPDAFIVMGSLTWSGADAEFEQAKAYLAGVKAPVYVTPGPNDLVNGSMDRFVRHFGKQNVAGKSLNIRGVHLQFASPVLDGKATDHVSGLAEMTKNLAASRDAKGVLLFGGLEYQVPRDPKSAPAVYTKYWQAIRQFNVAARLTAGHAHTVGYQDTLPIWTVPSSAWTDTPNFSLAIITVYPKRIELALRRDPLQPMQTLVIPNPVTAKRMPRAADDPYGLPTYSEDLARKPDLTFLQMSDSQFDNIGSARYRMAQQMSTLAVKQVNRLKPAFAFMTGDLTNNNIQSEWETFGRIYSKLTMPLYTMPGNHDTLYDRAKLNPKTAGKAYAVRLKSWQLAEKIGGAKATDPTTNYSFYTKKKPYYAVEKNGCVFLCLNTGFASVDREQMKWLAKELERTKDAKHVFVLSHYPVLQRFGGNVQGPEAQEILHLLRKYKVAAYLSGHRHRYDYYMHDYTTHILCDDLCWGEYCAYQIYHVFPEKIIACWRPIFRADGNRPLYERVEIAEPRFVRK